MLPDLALLEMFDFYMEDSWEYLIPAWHTLVHVCRKWRNIVFGCPRRLNLHLHCHPGTPVRERLNIWPVLPINIRDDVGRTWADTGNIVAALEHNSRIGEVILARDANFSSSQLEEVLVAMQKPFPTLRRLELQPKPETTLVIPASFLGGSAPDLRQLLLGRFLFPGLPKLLSSATQLVQLELWGIPHSGYISPEVMATCLSVSTRLQCVCIEFESPRSRPDLNIRRPPPPTHILLPVLTMLEFKGVAEYLEDLVARIDAPLLGYLAITFFHQLIFDTPRLTQFITRTPNFKAHDHELKASVFCSRMDVSFSFENFPEPNSLQPMGLRMEIPCRQLDWQLSCMAQVCNSSFPQALIPAVKRLYIRDSWSDFFDSQDDIENSQWLELFYPFTGVKNLYLTSKLVPHIAPALRELVGERLTEVLPALRTVFLEELLDEPFPEAIGQFVVARQLAGYPTAISSW